jgi:hypothetical protein
MVSPIGTIDIINKERAMATKRMTVNWASAYGLITSRSITTDGGASTILTDLQALSNATGQQYWEGDVTFNSNVPSTAPYLSVVQIAVLEFEDASGFTARLSLPAPQSGIFLSDGTTIDPSMISTLITDCIGTLQTAMGTLVTSFKGGWLQGASANGGSSS